MLSGRNLVVLGFGEDAELPQFGVQLLHERLNTRLERAEIMVVQLLPAGCGRAEERSAAEAQILAALIHRAVNKEILLLCANRGAHAARLVAEQVQDAHRLRIQRLHRAEQRRFFVQRLPAVGAERRRDAEGLFLNKSIGSRIPRGVAARLKGGAQTARGEGGGVRLALDEALARQLHDHAVARRLDKAVMLLGGDAGHRLEPVREVRRAVLQRPLLHRVCHDICHIDLQRRVLIDRLLQRLVHVLRQFCPHDPVIEDERPEQLGNLIGVDHLVSILPHCK